MILYFSGLTHQRAAILGAAVGEGLDVMVTFADFHSRPFEELDGPGERIRWTIFHAMRKYRRLKKRKAKHERKA